MFLISGTGILFLKVFEVFICLATTENLGHIISSQGISPDKSKIKAMLDWPIPKTLNNYVGVLSLTGYYKRFIKNYASITFSFTKLFRKDKFWWTDQSLQSFNALKLATTQPAVLALSDFTKPFVIQIDAWVMIWSCPTSRRISCFLF